MSEIPFNRLYGLILVILVGVIIAGCVKNTHFAPVINGWLQPNAKKGFYRVKEGDTIYSIALAFGLDYRALAAVNHLRVPYTIGSGDLLHMTNVPYGQKITLTKLVQESDQPLPLKQPKPMNPAKSRRSLFHWQWPAKGRIIGPYSATAPMAGDNRGLGLDITGDYGEPIHATFEGVVVYSGAGVRGYGNLIILKHNEDYLSAYAFNKRILVKKGNKVRTGQKIAEMGRTDSGCVMLHFEIRRNGKPVNPLCYLS
ncbi:peptidoglycan DD-metalloendopeptidase family protein [Coxiella endosymbiont of Amblyomma nuttalli]|uniref:peptidoglycan DD-metalloendopeptidase family protein n=1 Tax=Coxiella endosymbiont of Amblyomma nuttalli TaxID=2749996 RepID=UPI001BB69CD5|nr:peptidoglycan DD-metalloendopeptidase family protein [Coxiella endosymbiont of Amblyomma nuttalli]QTS84194.1 Murein hydrolase activator NlpD precursor [Coxiella endosymbiont of Amblyomma nuttalli]